MKDVNVEFSCPYCECENIATLQAQSDVYQLDEAIEAKGACKFCGKVVHFTIEIKEEAANV